MMISFAWGLAWFVLWFLRRVTCSRSGLGSRWFWASRLLESALGVVRRLTARFIWTDRHGWRLSPACSIASMSAGVIASGITVPIDMAAKMVFDAVAVVLLIAYFEMSTAAHEAKVLSYRRD